MSDGSLQDRLRRLPAVDRVVDALTVEAPREVLLSCARRALDESRSNVRGGAEPATLAQLVDSANDYVRLYEQTLLKRVINATGVLIHTNLGRVPLGKEQLEAVRRVASGYSNLEYDLTAGRRGSRLTHADRLLAQASGAEAGIVVNNNAAAILLTLAGVCSRREVVISRGELVEIGGEFRIPDVMDIAGARLVEVGTTNRTHLADYEKAITEHTAAILKVHPSNYKVVGFASSVEARDLARLARGRGISFIHDIGSGLLTAPGEPGWSDGEPTVTGAVAEGADVVSFSGDKLLGGPQAGLLVGRSASIERLRTHPLIRALRVDKMTLAALEVTLEMHLRGRARELPLWSMATATSAELSERSKLLAAALRSRVEGLSAEAVETTSVPGGGSVPGAEIASFGVSLGHVSRSPSEIERALRTADPPVIARVETERVLLDLRTVAPAEDEILADLVASALGA
ncbi:MAG: L-seryl-tRNA(Sec) selenium transferase [Actinomycetota bacterium]|nr:L-seryl-tRNA(Sec) selenium transferase [Actinomycetota bacterium]